MESLSIDYKINLFKTVFKGREDAFAKRFENKGKSGYMPVCTFDPYMYRLHKMKGGSYKDYSDKTLLPLSDDQIIKHLKGEQQIGIYPLLKDNTSWFIVADFDKDKWADECKAFIRACSEKGLTAYLERSRSGNSLLALP